MGDATLQVKWKFFEKNGLSFALKPGIDFPTGNDDRGLGTGKIGGSLFLIASREMGPWAFHDNLGYMRNENNCDDRKDIWHASFAATWEVIKDLKLVANVGIERDRDDEANEDPAFIIGGIIYSVNEHFDVDLGVKGGLTRSETNISALAGVTLSF